MKIELFPPVGLSETGQRSNNQDCIYPSLGTPLSEQEKLFIVCDGVGGAAKGELASAMACEVLSDCLDKNDNLPTETVIQDALNTIEDKIDAYVRMQPDAKGMATTMTLFAIDPKGVVLAHIGDSRIYQVRKGQLIYKTKDHSLVNEMLEAGIISAAEAIGHPKKNVITRVLGAKDPNAAIFRLKEVTQGDYFLLCTDGILEGINESALLDLLGREDLTNEEKMLDIKNRCEEAARDNFSAYLLQVREVEKNLVETVNELYATVLRKVK